jgi:hypothetical protein
MIRVAIINDEGKIVSPAELSTATELQQAVEQARNLIRECDRLAQSKQPTRQAGRAPYSQ